MSGHLDPLGLDAVRAGEGSPEEREHAAGCPGCRAAVEGLRALAARLAAGPRIEVPDSLRRTILAEARERIKPPGLRRFWIPLAAAAAAVLVAIVGSWTSRPPAIPGDVDRSGAVDILDAYALALRIRSGERLDPRWDFNGDGVVDQKDVDAVGMTSVSISRGRRG